MDDQVTALLRRAADVGGDFVPPDIAGLATRGRRRRLTRTALAVAGVVVLVAGLAVALSHVSGSDRPSAAKTQPSDPAKTQPSHPTPAVPLSGPSISSLIHGQWNTLPAAPIAARYGAAGVWTGRVMLVWGGTSGDRVYDDGAAYNPRARTWRALPSAPLSPREDPAYAWTGHELFVWGGEDASGRHQAGDGAVFDPGTWRWSRLPAVSVSSYSWADAVVVGGRVVLLSAKTGEGVVHAAEYDPGAGAWSTLPDLSLPSPHEFFYAVAVGAGGRLLLWSMWSHTVQTSPTSGTTSSGVDPYALDVSARSWASAPLWSMRGRSPTHVVWTGAQVLIPATTIYCGPCSPPGDIESRPAGSIDPTTGSEIPIAPGPASTIRATFVWTGRALLALDSGTYMSGPTGTRPGDAALWDPVTNEWRVLPRAPAYSTDGVVVWAGDRVLIWGQLHAGSGSATATGLELVPRD